MRENQNDTTFETSSLTVNTRINPSVVLLSSFQHFILLLLYFWYLYIYYIYIHIHVFRPAQDLSVWLGLMSREQLMSPECSKHQILSSAKMLVVKEQKILCFHQCSCVYVCMCMCACVYLSPYIFWLGLTLTSTMRWDLPLISVANDL